MNARGAGLLGFVAGAVVGVAVGILAVEKKLKAEYEESTASMRRAYEAAHIDSTVDEMLAHPDVAHVVPRDSEGTALVNDLIDPAEHFIVPDVSTPVVNIFNQHQPVDTEDLPVVDEAGGTSVKSDNPYHTAVAETANPGAYVSFAELSEEDYQEDDGRSKEQLTMLYVDNEPQFFKDGAELEVSVAMDMVGSTIVDDMRKTVREGFPVLWVRNNQTDIDYEVVFDQP